MALMMLIVFLSGVMAQSKGIAVFLRGGYIYAHDAKEVLKQIAPYEISGFTNNFALLGIESYYRNNKWIFGLEASMGAQKETKEQKRSGGLILGFRIAYRFSPANDNWKDDKGNELSDMPSYRNNVFYITLIAAGGYFKNK